MVAALLQHLSTKYDELLDHETALFYAERLVAHARSESADLLLARLYYRAGKTKQAHLILQGATEEDNLYLLARCSADLGLLREAEHVLLSLSRGDSEGRVPGAAAGLCLLGSICRREHRTEAAIAYYKRALQLDPFMWSAIIGLNELQAEVDFAAMHSLPVDLTQPDVPASADPLSRRRLVEDGLGLSADKPSRQTDEQSKVSTSLGLSSLPMRLPLPSPGSASPQRESTSGFLSVSGRGGGFFDTPGLTPIAADYPRTRNVNRALEFGASTGPAHYPHDEDDAADASADPMQRLGRRVSFGATARLSFSSVPGVLTDADDDYDGDLANPSKLQRTKPGDSSLASDYRSKLRSYVSYARPPMHEAQGGRGLPPVNTLHSNGVHNSNNSTYSINAGNAESSEAVARLVVCLAEAHCLLCANLSPLCIAKLHTLPQEHFRSAYAQHLLGLAYFNTSDYRACLLTLREMMRLEPFRVKGLEILSTALWHLKRERDLAALAQQCVDIDKEAPEVWCVVGNCFSLQREHGTAIKFFERATQVCPTFLYAYTLCGHEHFANENYERAVACFRQAIALDERHFNAWYGLGVVYFRQERLDLAEYHFRRALTLNSASSVLACYLGMVLHNSGDERKKQEALAVLSSACAVDASNPQLHFQLAHVYLSVDRLESALAELNIVVELAPREPPVYSLLGQVCLRLGRRSQAVGYFNTAVSLDSKEMVAMKAAFEAHHINDDLI